MSLIACPECEKQISTNARWCPACGYPARNSEPLRADVTDIEMGFGSMIRFMLKWAIASIPALFILFALVVFLAGALGAKRFL